MAGNYNEEFFGMHTGWIEDYEQFAYLLLVNFKFKTVIDLGCGNAYIASTFAKLGKTVTAIDSAEEARGYVDNVVIEMHDLTKPITEFTTYDGERVDLPVYDLVMCLEVAEHLPPEAADTLVHSIADVAKNYVVFSAAEAGYGGTDHLNEQPKDYWREKFEARGFEQDMRLTTLMMWGLLECTNIWWFAKNIMIFKRRLV